MFNNSITVVPEKIGQDYLWLAEYHKGSVMERNIETEKSNSFYEIEKEKLVRFGLIGRGKKMWFECSGGTFNLLGRRINIRYRVGEKTYDLTSQNVYQRDIITYKKAYAEADASGRSGVMKNRIVSYSYGYKSELEIDGVQFNFKAIVNAPHGEDKGYQMSVSLVSDEDLDGKLEFLDGDHVLSSYEAPLQAGITGQLLWNLR